LRTGSSKTSEVDIQMSEREFKKHFEVLTGNKPFPWQIELFMRFIADREESIPCMANLPTGLGKTSVIAVWLLALAKRPKRMPRRLVYVVNRRTVVDQTTREAENLKTAVENGKLSGIDRLAISTLRGQFADNQEWSADPSRPAVICGTVDMIGSRLLFGGYRIGFKSRPLHAGFLGQDALLVHDEAHLEPAFQELVTSIEAEQRREREREPHRDPLWPKLHVMAMSATARSGEEDTDDAIGLKDPDYEHSIVAQRVKATKTLYLHPCEEEKNNLVADVTERATTREHLASNRAIVIFLRLVDDVEKVAEALRKKLKAENQSEHVVTLTGTMRGLERDELVCDPAFIRFLPKSDRPDDMPPAEGAVYLVCTSAGEVGVNLSADHMVCDLSTFDSMAQRLGRVNRFGDRDDTRVDVVHPAPGKFDDKNPLTPARKATLKLLDKLNGDASPKALGDLPADQRLAAFTPNPVILPVTDILFDAWALTTIRGKMPGRPPVAPYLHGVAEWEPPRTSLAWREEVECITEELIEREGQDFLQELIDDYPLKPQELLSDRTDRIYARLEALIAEPNKSVKGEKRKAALHRARRNTTAAIWIIDDSNAITVTTLGKLMKGDKKRVLGRLADGIVLLPPSVGGLSGGLLEAQSEHADDVADQWFDEAGMPRRMRISSDDRIPADGLKGMALIRTIDTDPDADEYGSPDEQDEVDAEPTELSVDEEASKSVKKSGRFWHWYARPRDAEDATRASARPITWNHHTRDVVDKVKQIVNDLDLPDDLKEAVVLAAELHDLGKQRESWQRSIGNPNPNGPPWYAKPGKPENGPRWRPRQMSDYRHEFGSLLDVLDPDEFHLRRLEVSPPDMQDVVLHLIAAHHGYARPHFPPKATIDPNHAQSTADDVTVEAMRRFARLQRRYGRWGLAYLESLLRAADWAASAEPSKRR